MPLGLTIVTSIPNCAASVPMMLTAPTVSGAVPVFLTLTVAVAEPSDVFLLDRLKAAARCDVQLAIASARDIRRTLQTYLPDSQVFVIDDIIDDVQGDAVELIEESIDDIVNPSQLEGIEVYTHAAEVPAQFAGSGSNCGVIALWTKNF